MKDKMIRLATFLVVASLVLAACSAAAPTPTAAPTQEQPTALPTLTPTITPIPSNTPTETPAATQTLKSGVDLVSLADKKSPSVILITSDGEVWGCVITRCQAGIYTDGKPGYPQDVAYVIVFDSANSPFADYEIITVTGTNPQGKLVGRATWAVKGDVFHGVKFETALDSISNTTMKALIADVADWANDLALCFSGNGLSTAYHCQVPSPAYP